MAAATVWVALAIAPALGGGSGSPAANPPAEDTKPIPDTDPGGHRAQIWGQAFTPNGLSFVSASSDRTLRIWSIETGKYRVIRGMRSAGSVGKLFALALSPDGATAAVGGVTGASRTDRGDIRLIDLATGEQVGRLSGHAGFVRCLAYSKDGKWLASADDKGAIKIWSTTGRREVGHIDNKIGSVESKAISNLAFVDQDHLVATALDGMRIFKREPLTLEKFLPSAEPETALAVSSNGALLAVAGEAGVVRVLSWPALVTKWEFSASRKVLGLAFGVGPSANRLAVASGKEPYLVTAWDVPSQSHTATYEGHDNVVHSVAFSPDGTTIASVGGNANGIHLWSLTEAEKTQEPAKATRLLQGGGRTVWNVGFLEPPENSKAAGTYLSWGYEDGCYGSYSCPDVMGPLSHALRLPNEREPALGDPFTLAEAPWLDASGRGTPPVEHRAILKTRSGALRGESQPDTGENLSRLILDRDGAAAGIGARNKKNGEEYTSFSFDPTGSWIVSGGRNNMLEVLMPDGTPIRQLDGHDGNVPAVAVSPDGRFIASGSNDQTMRLWSSGTGKLVVSILHLPTDGRWIMWTPQGYFAASPGAEDLIGWHIDRGPDKSADFVTAGEVRSYFHNRDLVARAIVLASAEDAVAEFRTAGRLADFKLEDLASRGPPNLRVLEPRHPFDPNATVPTKNGTIDVVLALLDNTDDIEKYEVWVNGNQVIDVPASDVTDLVQRRVRFQVPLFADFNNIVVAPRSRKPERVQRDWRIPVRLDARIGPLDIRDQAYVIAIGVNGYKAARPLSFARDDAAEFALAMDKLLKNNHPKNRARPIVLIDGARHPKLDPALFDLREPTRVNIAQALQVFRKAGQKDTIVLFLAGHGTNRTSFAPGFVFLPIDANKDADGFTQASTVPWSEFQSALDAGNGRKIVFLDACRSAHVDFGLNDLVDRNLAVYSSTRPLEDALERSPHGMFTAALLAGLGGAARKERPEELEFDELGLFVRIEVRRQSGNQQTPTHYAPQGMTPFPVVRYCGDICTPPQGTTATSPATFGGTR